VPSNVEYFQASYREFQDDNRRRLGAGGAQPRRLGFKALE
jgi:hypothetical protein